MAEAIKVGAIHHMALTVTNLQRSQDFYTGVLGFQAVAALSAERVIISNGQLMLALSLSLDLSQTPDNDRFSEFRSGLDHISFTMPDRASLEEAVRVFDTRGISHGTINDLSPAGLPIYVLSFRDPDNIQLELSAPVT